VIRNLGTKGQAQPHVCLGKIARDAVAYQCDLSRAQVQTGNRSSGSSPVTLIDHVDDLVRRRVDDANLVANDEIAVIPVVREEADHVARHWEEVHAARDSMADMVIEVDA
jgi:hypothetical protein